ncbi:hypothetical protein E7Z59_06955 [Robertkochia marina]|uniref:Uncharacterized protein n=1 Tax=Robertkochia marina TaxID=1227945 RepID=A0A4S3M1Q6_9FLAO|nr:hypothetical protein [Robertkochia marina]THD67395.1 hypothetical protein E7Z59_06955 [Robertkochia marina]TRZ43049.1 hypothetical protein D3A96_11260 [Robertkochia marina]
MKKAFKITSITSILLFGIAWILHKTTNLNLFNSDIRLLLVLTYLFTSMRYYQIQVQEKNEVIKELTSGLDDKNKTSV